MTTKTPIADKQLAINELVDKIVGEALVKLSCLSLGDEVNVRQRLKGLINKTVLAKDEGGEHCTGAWDTDDTFVVTVQDHIDVGDTRISVALSLGETKIKI